MPTIAYSGKIVGTIIPVFFSGFKITIYSEPNSKFEVFSAAGDTNPGLLLICHLFFIF